MLKLILILVGVAAALFILAVLGIMVLMIYIIVTTPKEDHAPSVRYQARETHPVNAATLFRDLSEEAKAYAARPFVTSFLEASAGGLRTTVCDPFNRRAYVITTRRVSKTLATEICVYENGGHEPVVRAGAEIPVSQVDWNAYHAELREVADDGCTMIYNDEHGRHRSVRLPRRKGRHHA